MFIPGGMAFFSQVFSLASTLFMIWMLVDCIRNHKVSNKGGWIFFILFTQIIGATVYFFTRGPWSQIRQTLFPARTFSGSQTPHTQDYQAAPLSQTERGEPFAEYTQGYQARKSAISHEYPPISEAETLPPEYEQSLVVYPEMPSMQQHQE
ncbi:MAG TPA: PLD nuclease N-terminal domain-containing protein [Ktedonobacteraceae bacterium]|nr:PLD nuclease N-terminal domain-containing protein [Ktedonobacteraceae bacterium]